MATNTRNSHQGAEPHSLDGQQIDAYRQQGDGKDVQGDDE